MLPFPCDLNSLARPDFLSLCVCSIYSAGDLGYQEVFLSLQDILVWSSLVQSVPFETSLVWSGLVESSLDWSALVKTGPEQSGPIKTYSDWFVPFETGLNWLALVWGLKRSRPVRIGLLWWRPVQTDLV